MSECKKCGRLLTNDEIGLHKRMINRGDTEFMCMTCLAEFFGCGEELLQKKIVHFRNMGCTLFAPNNTNE